ncbi:hypothetical protein [Maricaulis sp.]|uniref:hypothetical protein n=1 Tax=Maricaulis sp. TaxID=1486257 RepID=UPI002B27B760|nr:hypothetical protein [Maricaulis sp.]
MTLTTLFLGLIGLLFMLGLYAQVHARKADKDQSKHAGFAASMPGLLTTFGVFGTFVGILIGLLGFDVTQVDESVPLLLEGLKTAFWSSVAGMGAAIAFRLLQPLIAPPSGGTSTDPIEILQAIEMGIGEQTRALSGGEDASLLTQIQKLRTSIQDGNDANRAAVQEGFERQIEAFNAFAKEMAENNSKALIEALNEVIRDFNEKLTEQFGENFKQLNEAVGQLLEWQERYKQHIEESEECLKSVGVQLETAAQTLTEVSKSVETMPERAAAIDRIMADLGEQLEATAGLTNAVATLRTEVSGAMPAINENIDLLTTGFAAKVQESADALRESAAEAKTHYSEAADHLAEGMDRLEKSLEQAFSTFDEQMQEELKRSLEVMGNHLASISAKLADDYERTADAVGSLRVVGAD